MRARGSRALALLLCIAAATAAFPSTSTPLQVWPCSAGSESQTWSLSSGPSPSANVLLGGAGGVPLSGLTLNTLGYSNSSGGILNVWTLAPSTPWGQQWQYDGARGRLVSLTNGLCAGTANSSTPLPAGSAVVQVPCADVATARWSYSAATGALSWAGGAGLCLDAGSATSCAQAPTSGYPFCNASLSFAARAADVIARLQDVEAAALLSVSNNGVPRLGVPPLRFGEALHGVLCGCGAPHRDPASGYTSSGCPTSFPTGLALGATFNASLWRAVGRAIGVEARALANQGLAANVLFTPDINPFRDPRWGRGMEVPSEDPLVCGAYGAAYVAGFQAADAAGYAPSLAAPKHAVGYDQEGNFGPHDRTQFCAMISGRDLVDYFLPPFEAALRDGGAAGVMCAASGYGVDGVPGQASCAHSDINNGVLREQWGWGGLMVTDGNGVGYLYETYGSHGLNCGPGATGPTGACRAGLRGGVDIELGETLNSYALAAIADGNITRGDIDLALSRTLPALFRLGLLDPPAAVPSAALGPADVDTAAHRALALEAARQSVVLLRNNASGGSGSAPLLPLSLAALAGKTLAIVGPNMNASDSMLANYHGSNAVVAAHTPLLALSARAAAAGVAVAHAPGCATVLCPDESGFAAAVDAARGAALAVFIGGNAPWRGGAGAFNASEGEEYDRAALTLGGAQEALLAAVLATGTPTVVVLMRGGPIGLSPALFADAALTTLVDLLYPGELGGEALADVLTGAFPPVGRLPTTTYAPDFVGTRAIDDYNFSSGEGVTYRFYRGAPQQLFGAGLSYTQWRLAWLSAEHQAVDAAAWARGEAAAPAFTLNVTNVGTLASGITALAFVAPQQAQPGDPLQRLFAFDGAARVEPGASALLRFSPAPALVARVAADGERALHAERLRVSIGMPGLLMLEATLAIEAPDGPVLLARAPFAAAAGDRGAPA